MEKLAKWIINYRKLLITLIALITIILGVKLPALHPTDEENTWFSPYDSVLKVYKSCREEFPVGQGVLIAYQVEDPLDPKEINYLLNLGEKLKQIPYVNKVVHLANVEFISGTEEGLVVEKISEDSTFLRKNSSSIKQLIVDNPFIFGNLVSRDWKKLAVYLKFEIPEEESENKGNIYVDISRELRKFLKAEEKQTGRKFHLSGEIIMDGEINSIIAHDIAIFFPLSLLVSFLIIFYLFRTPGSVIISLATVTIALIWTLGLMAWFDVPLTPVSATLFALINIIGLANAIHLFSQLGIEVQKDNNREKAIGKTLEIAGKACFFTSLTTAVGFGSLIVSNIPAIRHLGYFAAFGIMSAYLIAMILVPAFASNPKFKLQVISSNHLSIFQPIIRRIITINLRYPRLILFLNTFLIIIALLGAPLIKTEANLLEYLKRSSPLYKDTKFIDENFTGVSSIEVVIYGSPEDFLEPQHLKLIESFQESLKTFSKVGVVYSGNDLLKLINRALHASDPAFYSIPAEREAIAQSFLLYEISGGSMVEEYINSDYSTIRVSIITKQCTNEEREELLAFIQNYGQQFLQDFKVVTTGIDYLVNQVTLRIIKTQVESLVLAFFVIALLMIFQFGWKAGLVSIIPNIFPVALITGLMGYAGFKLNMATAIIASIAIGIVVDDTIHFFSHFKSAYLESGDQKSAMQKALLEVGPALISASLVLTLGFIIETLSRTSILLEFGILSGIAIMSALCGDLFVGPVLLYRYKFFSKRK